jgi:hypothetical protein
MATIGTLVGGLAVLAITLEATGATFVLSGIALWMIGREGP